MRQPAPVVKVIAVARATAAETLRRRTVAVLMVLLPLAFYLVRRDLTGQSVRFLALGVGWAVATLALFGGCSARPLDERLRLLGYSAGQLVTGRLITATGSGLAVATCYYLVTVVDQDIRRSWAVALLLLTTVLVAAPFGAMVAALMPRELEGTLALLCIVAVQMLADPAGRVATVLPFWSTRELGTYAIDGTDAGYLNRGMLHFAVTAAVALAVTIVAAAVRLRLHVPAEPPWPTEPAGPAEPPVGRPEAPPAGN